MARLSFRDLFKFCYLEQEELDSAFFRLNTPILAEKSKDSLNFFAGYYSEVLSTLQIAFDQTRSDQRAKREAAERIREFLRGFDFASPGQIREQLDQIRARSEELRTFFNRDSAGYLHDTHFVDEQRLRLRRMSDLLDSERQTLEDLDYRLNEQRELRPELLSMKFKVARANRARSVLEGSVFENCPQCGQPVSAHRAPPGDCCYLCLPPVQPAPPPLRSTAIWMPGYRILKARFVATASPESGKKYALQRSLPRRSSWTTRSEHCSQPMNRIAWHAPARVSGNWPS